MKAVILQPSYIPWRGFFDLIHQADVFVFYDDVQFDRRGWRNRNKVKAAEPGGQWLTIPVLAKGHQIDGTAINEIAISWDRDWAHKHWSTIKHVYGKAPHFKRYAPLVESFYMRHDERLASFTIETTIALARELGIEHTRFLRSSELGVDGTKTDRLLAVLAKIEATHYISGPSARDYIEPEKFAQAGIGLGYAVYEYREYPQLHGSFDANLSILDLLFMTGPDAGSHIWGAARS